MQETKQFLEENFSCPICFDLLKNPTTTECGHNFCLECLKKNKLECAVCRKASPKPPVVNFGLKKAIDNWKLQEKPKDHNIYHRNSYSSSECKRRPVMKHAPISERQNKYRYKRLFNEMVGFEKESKPSNFSQANNLLSSESAINNFLDNLMKQFNEESPRENYNFYPGHQNYHNAHVRNSFPTPISNNLHLESQIGEFNYINCEEFSNFNLYPAYTEEKYFNSSFNVSQGQVTKRFKKF